MRWVQNLTLDSCKIYLWCLSLFFQSMERFDITIISITSLLFRGLADWVHYYFNALHLLNIGGGGGGVKEFAVSFVAMWSRLATMSVVQVSLSGRKSQVDMRLAGWLTQLVWVLTASSFSGLSKSLTALANLTSVLKYVDHLRMFATHAQFNYLSVISISI